MPKMSRRVSVYLADILIVAVSGLVAFALRENFEPNLSRLTEGWFYHASALIVASLTIPMLGLDRSIWRFSSLPDYVRAFAACTIIVAGASLLTLGATRFDGVARSLPFIHIVLATFMMVGVRVLFRYKHRRRHEKRRHLQPVLADAEQHRANILVIGLTRLTETYLQAVEELASNSIRVVGLLGTKDRHVGRLVSTIPVLGLAEDIESVFRDLEPHGTTINRVVITCPFAELSPFVRAHLLALEEAGSCELQLFAEQLHLVNHSNRNGSGIDDRDRTEMANTEDLRFEFPATTFDAMANRSYWRIKRGLDIIAALGLLIILSPIIVMTTILVAVSMGFPVTFWQQRPGQGGNPFRVYKFRTMRRAHDLTGRLLDDSERVSMVGNFLRRTRLDELLQLWHVIVGDMSFVGPRPLLPRDQANCDSARLLVRPGLTGWAQVVGGRTVSSDDKAALDIWYIKNASFALDCRIVLKTIPIVLRGETVDYQSIKNAWRELRDDGILTLNSSAETRLNAA